MSEYQAFIVPSSEKRAIRQSRSPSSQVDLMANQLKRSIERLDHVIKKTSTAMGKNSSIKLKAGIQSISRKNIDPPPPKKVKKERYTMSGAPANPPKVVLRSSMLPAKQVKEEFVTPGAHMVPVR